MGDRASATRLRLAKCSVCGAGGHNRRTCDPGAEPVGQMRDPHVVDFAAAARGRYLVVADRGEMTREEVARYASLGREIEDVGAHLRDQVRALAEAALRGMNGDP